VHDLAVPHLLAAGARQRSRQSSSTTLATDRVTVREVARIKHAASLDHPIPVKEEPAARRSSRADASSEKIGQELGRGMETRL